MATPRWHFERLNKIALIKAILRDGRSQRCIAKEAGTSVKNLYHMTDLASKRKFIRLETLDALCKTLNVPREELIL